MNKLIQWSVNGACSHLAEIEHFAAQQQPFMICLQRCKLTPKDDFKLRNFIPFEIESDVSCPSPGDVLTLIHESVPMVARVKLDSKKIRAVAVSVALPKTHSSTITICNMHIPTCETITYRDMQLIVTQLPKPFILMGNFYEEKVFGTLQFANPEIENLNEEKQITHLDRSTGHFFVEDMTFATSDLAEKIEWTTYRDLNDSDHFPIILTFPLESIYYTVPCPKWKIDEANWPLFEKQTEINSEHLANVAEDIEFFSEMLLKAGHAAIQKTSGEPIVRRRITWLNSKIEEAITRRRSALNELRTRRTIPNLKRYLKLCDDARLLMNCALQEHWDEYTSSINEFSPMPSNWRKINFINGKNQRNPPIKAIFRGKQLITEPAEIVDVLASHYSTVSSNASYSAEFLEHKETHEATKADFGRSNEEEYNCPIAMRELDYCLQHHNFQSNAGPDEIHPMMLKYIHESAKKYLLDIYNRIWCSGEFPKKWKLAMVIPTLKKGKEKTLPTSYRPVALTSALAKLFEKIVQKRLMWVLEAKKYWSDHQYGFRKQRSNTQTLVDLHLRVKKAFDNKSHLYAVFFDLQTASETVWKHQILMHLHAAGIRGRMGRLIQNFITDREIFVRIGKYFSKTYAMANGLPQGSILSETLLLVALNDIQNAIEAPVNFSLFVDDLVITYESSSPSEARDVVQKSINRITSWASQRGFKFSAEKTTIMDFYEAGKSDDQFELTISGQQIKFSDTVLYLGMTIDSKWTWEAHINQLKEGCSNTLELMEKINNKNKGGDQKMLLRIYTSYMKSRLDYGSLVFGSADPNLLDSLDKIPDRAIRIAMGAYPTSPWIALYGISGKFPSPVSRQLSSANFLGNALSTPDLPLNKLLFDDDGGLHDKSMSYLRYVTKNFESFLPKFCKFVENPPMPQIFSDPPPWLLRKPMINLNLKEYAELENPEELPAEEIREKFNNEMSKYPNYTQCYTDGSKTDNKVGAAFSVSSFLKQLRLPKQCSSYTAELVAIFKCLEYLSSFKSLSHFIIITDSLTALENLSDTYTFNPLLQRILLLHNSLIESDIQIVFLWVPSHCGIEGNEFIDRAAREASKLKKINCQMYTSLDVKSYLKSLIVESWQQSYESQKEAGQLVLIKPNPSLPPSSPFRSKRESDILTRLRISHTGLTHSHLIKKREPPVCPHCTGSILTVEHILTICPGLEKKRSEFELPSSLPDLLNDESHIKSMFKYLHSLNFLDRI